jgi:hypothetical protein
VPGSPGIYYRRFGDWGGMLRALKIWVATHASEFPYGRELDRRLANQARPFAFRGMASAPVNEMGVVLVFGMVAADIGYAVEAVGTAFPDCSARRPVVDELGGALRADARWEPVRVEFEYRSRYFFYHGHEVDECDVIICWQHEWPDCPLEVLALEDVVASLMEKAA